MIPKEKKDFELKPFSNKFCAAFYNFIRLFNKLNEMLSPYIISTIISNLYQQIWNQYSWIGNFTFQGITYI